MVKNLLYKALVLVLVLLVGAEAASAQKRTVRGTVSDSEGPMVGVSVVLRDPPPVGVSTGVKGDYELTVPGNEAVLVFSFVGYRTVEVPVGTQTQIDVMMEPEVETLDEVVVVGYGTQTKSHLTGSIAKLDGEALADRPVSDLTTALQGQIPGLQVNNLTSEVGVAPQIRVRGTGSISADSSPLIVVDGFPGTMTLADINPADVKSIEILKDAASAAIYGSRAANGVILVTTKSGQAERPRYSVKFYQGVKWAYQLHDLLTQTEYYQLQQFEESVGGPAAKAQDRAGAWLESNLGSTDWQREGLRDAASITNVQFSVSGGKKDVRYYTSASWTRDQGIMLQNEVQKVTFRTKLDADLSKAVKFGVNVGANYQKGSRPRNNFIDFYRTPSFLPVMHNDWSTAFTGGYTGFARGSHFAKISTPTGEPDEYGNPTWDKDVSPYSSANNNPKSVMANTERWNEKFSATGNIFFEVNICKGLTFRTSNGANMRYQPSYSYANVNATKDGVPSEATFGSSLIIDLLSENTLNWNATYGRHEIELLGGYTAQSTRYQTVYMTAQGFATDNIHTLNAATIYELAASGNGISAGTGTYRYPNEVLQSVLARANYAFGGKYLLSASIRADISSLFTKGNRTAWFPSVSLGWRVSEEPWLKSSSWLSNLKLRASYGVTGNNAVPHQASMALLGSMNYVTGTGNGSLTPGIADTSSTQANEKITWEQTDEYNIGLDWGMVDNRINLTVDAYYSITRALLFEQPTQSFTGYTQQWNNIGKVRNSGVEIQLDTYQFRRKRFEWSTHFNLSLSRNKLLEIGGEKEVITLGERNESYIARVGEPLIQFYGFQTQGVWNNTEEINSNPHFAQDVPGGLRIVDTNGDGKLSDADRVPLGNPYPDFTWGMTNRFRIGQFDISFLLQGVQGVTVLNGDVYYNETHKYNKAYIKDRWVSDSHRGDGKTPYAKLGYDIMMTDYPLQDASYFCLRDFTVGYTFSKEVARKMHLRGLRFYLTGTNLFYWWSDDYKGVNPESRMTSSQYASPMISGYQRGGFPLTSTVTFGIDINF